MARPLRIEVAGGWYHVVARGHERRAIFRDDRDRQRFLEVLAEGTERFRLQLHAYVLMDNHYHLLVETREPNLSRAMQWLGVSYSVWFNRRHRRVGHLFQGRFKGVVLEPSAAVEVTRYLHLNPVRVERLGMGKSVREQSRLGLLERPDPKRVSERLERLRGYVWSSYRAYAGRAKPAKWLTLRTVLGRMGSGGLQLQRQAYRHYVEGALRHGLPESPWDRLQAGVALGSREFVERIKRFSRGDPREQPQVRRLHHRPNWEQVVMAVERLKGEPWEMFRDRYGDWGRDLAFWLGRRCGGMKLRDLAQASGGIDYVSVASAVRRFGERLAGDRKLAVQVEGAIRELHNA